MGAQAPVALGVGFALKYKAEKNVAVCYLGDAAMNQGAVFEAMNMAAAEVTSSPFLLLKIISMEWVRIFE